MIAMLEQLQEIDRQKRLVESLRIHGEVSGCCHNDDGKRCAYRDKKLCNEKMCRDAADEIERIRAERDEWKRRAEAAERDLSELRDCSTCAYHGRYCRAKSHEDEMDRSCYEWRGPCAKNGGGRE